MCLGPRFPAIDVSFSTSSANFVQNKEIYRCNYVSHGNFITVFFVSNLDFMDISEAAYLSESHFERCSQLYTAFLALFRGYIVFSNTASSSND